SLARAQAEPSLFLAGAIADEIGHRMNLIRRDFAVTLVHGLGSQQTIRELDPSRHRRTITAGPHGAPGTQLIFDTEALPLAPESLDCMISLLTLQAVNDLPGTLVQMRRALRPDG